MNLQGITRVLVLLCLGALFLTEIPTRSAYAQPFSQGLTYACNNDICTPARARYRSRAKRTICANSARLERLLNKKKLLESQIAGLTGCQMGVRPPPPLRCTGWPRRLPALRLRLARIQAQIDRIVDQVRRSCDGSLNSNDLCERQEAGAHCPVTTEAEVAAALRKRCEDLKAEAKKAVDTCKPPPNNCNLPPGVAKLISEAPEMAAFMGNPQNQCPIPAGTATSVPGPTSRPTATPIPNPTATSVPALPSATPTPVATGASPSGSCKTAKRVGPSCEEVPGAV